jgi:Pyruvate/2-oxoacid:ferredoxin oxidoreductase gamma subunit
MHMDREVTFTGIGGQGVQLAAQVLARAATRPTGSAS